MPNAKLDKSAARLRTAADGLTARIEERLRPRLENTAKRAREAAAIQKEGENLKRLQDTLYALAAAHEEGSIPDLLAPIVFKSTIEEMLVHETYPLRSNWTASFLDQLAKANVHGDFEYAHVRKLLLEYVPKGADDRTLRLRDLERALVGRRILGFFWTPAEVVAQMIAAADIEPGMTILEPEAGKGDIADRVHAAHPTCQITQIEINHDLRQILELKGLPLLDHADFLTYETSPDNLFDRILMNPPFEAGQDIAHVYHAYEVLKPGGRIVAIMGAGVLFLMDKKTTAFRAFLDAHGAKPEKLPEGAFKASGTYTQAVMVVIDKPAEEIFMPEIETRPAAEAGLDAGDAPAYVTSNTAPDGPIRPLALPDVHLIPVASILRSETIQPRTLFDQVQLEELALSISRRGLLEPIKVRPHPTMIGKYEIVHGERRFRATCMIGLESIPAMVVDIEDEDAEVDALVENLQRVDLNAMDVASGFNKLIKRGWTQDRIAREIGIDQSTVATRLGLLKLPIPVQQLIKDDKLSASHGVAFRAIADDEDKILELAVLAADGKWSVHLLREHVAAHRAELDRSASQPLFGIGHEGLQDEELEDDAAATAAADPSDLDTEATAAGMASDTSRADDATTVPAAVGTVGEADAPDEALGEDREREPVQEPGSAGAPITAVVETAVEQTAPLATTAPTPPVAPHKPAGSPPSAAAKATPAAPAPAPAAPKPQSILIPTGWKGLIAKDDDYKWLVDEGLWPPHTLRETIEGLRKRAAGPQTVAMAVAAGAATELARMNAEGDSVFTPQETDVLDEKFAGRETTTPDMVLAVLALHRKRQIEQRKGGA